MNDKTYVETRTEYELLLKDESDILKDLIDAEKLLQDTYKILANTRLKMNKQVELYNAKGISLFSS
jgi:hypothetical protein